MLRHFIPRNDNRVAAFTLAEVLITLTIIGVIAALTIPNLMKNYQKKVTETKLRNTYSIIQQAIKLSELNNGNMEDWVWGTESTKAYTKNLVDTYIMPYIKNARPCNKNGYAIEEACSCYTISLESVEYILENGVALSFRKFTDNSRRIYLMITTKQNKNLAYVKNSTDLQSILENNSGKEWFYFVIDNGFIRPFGWNSGLTREQILTGYNYEGYKVACLSSKRNEADSQYRHACTALFYIDGLTFKDDYPVKF